MSALRSTSTKSVAAGPVRASSAPLCRHTLLTKPECHCRACLSEQIATYSPRTEQSQRAATLDVGRAAA